MNGPRVRSSHPLSCSRFGVSPRWSVFEFEQLLSLPRVEQTHLSLGAASIENKKGFCRSKRLKTDKTPCCYSSYHNATSFLAGKSVPPTCALSCLVGGGKRRQNYLPVESLIWQWNCYIKSKLMIRFLKKYVLICLLMAIGSTSSPGTLLFNILSQLNILKHTAVIFEVE